MTAVSAKMAKRTQEGSAVTPEADAVDVATSSADPRAERLRKLEEAINLRALQETTPAPLKTAKRSSPIKLLTVLKTLSAAVFIFTFGWTPLQRLLAVTSAEATVNARVITVRAPIEGEVSADLSNLEIGAAFNPGDVILAISDPRADHQHLDNLQEARRKATIALRSLEGRRAILVARQAELLKQTDQFRAARIAQLSGRMGEIDTQIASALADHDAAKRALERSKALVDRGYTAVANYERAVRDERVTREAFDGANERKRQAAVELDAARNSVFVGDSYNDTPQSAQREKDVEFEIADADVNMDGAKADLADIANDVQREIQRQEERSTAVLKSSVKGQVWEVFTAPGEHVNGGQDLVKLLDCSSADVTAAVSESAYQNLRIGQAATFRPRNGAAIVSGRISGLNGLASLTSNDAIAQGALSREPYHVTVRFPEMEKTSGCRVGESGVVTFLSPQTASAAHSATALAAQ
jgi:multidrug resistance efflux pump